MREKEYIREVILEEPVFDKPATGEVVRKFWITDYPLLCYLSRSSKDRTVKAPLQLVMVNLADEDAPMQIFKLKKGQRFISFVDTFYNGVDAAINVLLEEDDQLVMKKFKYLRPFAK